MFLNGLSITVFQDEFDFLVIKIDSGTYFDEQLSNFLLFMLLLHQLLKDTVDILF